MGKRSSWAVPSRDRSTRSRCGYQYGAGRGRWPAGTRGRALPAGGDLRARGMRGAGRGAVVDRDRGVSRRRWPGPLEGA